MSVVPATQAPRPGPAASAAPISTESAAERPKHPGRVAPRPRKQSAGWGTRIFALTTVLALAAGWWWRDDLDLTAKSGLGYALGITGGVLMLSLLLYPARKNARFMQRWGAVKHWFRLHMMFGVIGPLLILYHARFHFGSFNSNVALLSMLIVAGSGIIGRFIYAKIHHGLYGRRTDLSELREQLAIDKGRLGEQFSLSARTVERLRRFEAAAEPGSTGPLTGLFRLLFFPLRAAWTRKRVMRDLRRAIRAQARNKGWDRRIRGEFKKLARRNVRAYFQAVVKVRQFAFYERMFSLWHVVHIPLFVMLLVAGIAHVIAVHMY